MNGFSGCKATIIGLGFLMEYIFPCIRACIGEETGKRVNATTVDENGLEEKRARLGIEIQLGGNLQALCAKEPDLIFFAPPPSAAPAIAKTELAAYYEQRRKAGKPLPLLLAFPPSPAGAFYRETLGQDIKVVNIIPNMIAKVGELPVNGAACNLFTYPENDGWQPEEKAALRALFSPMGHCLEIPPSRILQALSTEMSAHPVTELAKAAADAFCSRGIACASEEAASALRAHHQARTGFQVEAGVPCSEDALPDEEARKSLFMLWDSWYDGALAQLQDFGMPPEDARRLLEPRYALFCLEAQVASREQILEHARKDATKGGMLELFMLRYSEIVEPRIRSLLAGGEASHEDAQEIGRLVCAVICAVIERGRGLSGAQASGFSPKHQAVLFGLLAQGILEEYGQERGDRLLWKAVERYGCERGGRMAKRALKNGDPLDMTSYFAYSEWSWSDGFSKSMLQKEPYYAYRVHSCPWNTGWEESGLTEYGSYYCRNVDVSIVKGFHPALTLEMPSILSAPGCSYCEFHWKDAAMTPEAADRQQLKERLGDSCQKDFVYHTAHLYSTLMRCACEEDAAAGRRLKKRVWKEFAERTSYQELLQVLALASADFTQI
ncbi:MAG: hypothetical protein HFG26_07080 [Provencibacterium sp.]|jgi:pyrroline-5-carboxylate reductase|nr:hypothetical protein [Provencibacterium sp.]